MNTCPNCGGSLIQKANGTFECECCGYVATNKSKLDSSQSSSSVNPTKASSVLIREVKKCENIIASEERNAFSELMSVGSKLVRDYPDYLDGYYFYLIGFKEIALPRLIDEIESNIPKLESSDFSSRSSDCCVNHDATYEKCISSFEKNKFYELKAITTSVDISQEEIENLIEYCNSKYGLLAKYEECVSNVKVFSNAIDDYCDDAGEFLSAAKKKIAGVIILTATIILSSIGIANLQYPTNLGFCLPLLIASIIAFIPVFTVQMVQVKKYTSMLNKARYKYTCLRNEIKIMKATIEEIKYDK